MATELTTASATSTVARRHDVEFRPIDWWADLDGDAIQSKSPRRKPPIPAFVRLSRLVDPEQIAAARGTGPTATVDAGQNGANDVAPNAVATDEPQLLDPDPEADVRRRWADSAGRPLFRIGMLAIVAAVVVGIFTFGPGGDDLATVEAPDPVEVVGPGVAGAAVGAAGNAEGATGNEEQARQVLEALVRQSAGAGEADLSIVGTAAGDPDEIRWTATIRNTGPETAEGPITVVHTIGSDFELLSVAGSGWDCRHLRSAGTITCELDEGLATGQRRRLGLVTTIAGAELGGSISSTMSVVAATTDPNLDDNTVNIMAETAPDDDAEGNRSRSTGAAGQAGSDTDADTTVGAVGDSSNDQAASAAMEELPRTGSGLAAFLGVAGVGLCLAGRRLTTWSARAQTRTLLVAANIG